MASRVYRLDGRVVTQAEYLDDAARRAGFPGGRREREQYRRAVRRAQKLGVDPPRPPTEAASYNPVPIAPAVKGRRKGQVYRIGREGHGRYLATGGPATARKEILRAARNNETLYITVTADGIVLSYPAKKSPTKAGAGGVPATDLREALEAAEGDVQAAITAILLEVGYYKAIGNITLYEIKSYRGNSG